MLPDAGNAFEREMSCELAEWLRWLPPAVGAHPLTLLEGAAQVDLQPGALHLAWTVLPPRQIALVRLRRLQVRFRFIGVADDARRRFMQRFDLFMQRGGG